MFRIRGLKNTSLFLVFYVEHHKNPRYSTSNVPFVRSEIFI
jgi:hypothetical protein